MPLTKVVAFRRPILVPRNACTKQSKTTIATVAPPKPKNHLSKTSGFVISARVTATPLATKMATVEFPKASLKGFVIISFSSLAGKYLTSFRNIFLNSIFMCGDWLNYSDSERGSRSPTFRGRAVSVDFGLFKNSTILSPICRAM